MLTTGRTFQLAAYFCVDTHKTSAWLWRLIPCQAVLQLNLWNGSCILCQIRVNFSACVSTALCVNTGPYLCGKWQSHKVRCCGCAGWVQRCRVSILPQTHTAPQWPEYGKTQETGTINPISAEHSEMMTYIDIFSFLTHKVGDCIANKRGYECFLLTDSNHIFTQKGLKGSNYRVILSLGFLFIRVAIKHRMQGADSPKQHFIYQRKKICCAHGACVTTRVFHKSSTYLHLRSWIYVETKRRSRSKTRLFVNVTWLTAPVMTSSIHCVQILQWYFFMRHYRFMYNLL